MKKLLPLWLIFALVSSLAAQPASQEAKPAETYKLNFKVYELEDGKRINERSYVFPAIATLANQRPRPSSIKVGVRTPLVASEHDKDVSFQYLEVGLNLDCTLEDVEGKLTASISVEMSNFALPEQVKDPRLAGDPVIRQQKQVFHFQLPLGKPVLVTSLDDINSKKRTQIEVTATKFE
ncbi:MAG TPA: hypothetical protein VG759_17540 [Candidatus Angelobacter sp.]|jgi:hypothetical protein|nr:hypothetical protein [Candidatus Angelobacter sp.]